MNNIQDSLYHIFQLTTGFQAIADTLLIIAFIRWRKVEILRVIYIVVVALWIETISYAVLDISDSTILLATNRFLLMHIVVRFIRAAVSALVAIWYMSGSGATKTQEHGYRHH